MAGSPVQLSCQRIDKQLHGLNRFSPAISIFAFQLNPRSRFTTQRHFRLDDIQTGVQLAFLGFRPDDVYQSSSQKRSTAARRTIWQATRSFEGPGGPSEAMGKSRSCFLQKSQRFKRLAERRCGKRLEREGDGTRRTSRHELATSWQQVQGREHDGCRVMCRG